MGSPAGYNTIMYIFIIWLVSIQISYQRKKKTFSYHTTSAVCHTADVSNQPADLSGMDLTSDPADLHITHSPGKAGTNKYSPQIFEWLFLFSESVTNKIQQILYVYPF